MSCESAHWTAVAKRWAQLGSPLRPCGDDLESYQNAIVAWTESQGRPPRALILGVTPELYRLPWPEGTHLAAADRARPMIEAVWPGPRESVVCADWTRLPFRSASYDLVFCDGGLHLLPYPRGMEGFAASVHRVLAPGGLLLLRLFHPPPSRETARNVLDDLLAGRISDLNRLKIRLGMSLQETPEGGVRLGDVWETLHQAEPDFDTLADRLGWTREHMGAFVSYRASDDRYHFVNVEEVLRLFAESPGEFERKAVHTPEYDLGERFPIMVLGRKGA